MGPDGYPVKWFYMWQLNLSVVLDRNGLLNLFLVFLLVEPSESSKTVVSGETVESELLEFSKFDINRVLRHGERLVGSSGAEYDLPDEDLVGECMKPFTC